MNAENSMNQKRVTVRPEFYGSTLQDSRGLSSSDALQTLTEPKG
jgi:hypothetical protein